MHFLKFTSGVLRQDLKLPTLFKYQHPIPVQIVEAQSGKLKYSALCLLRVIYRTFQPATQGILSCPKFGLGLDWLTVAIRSGAQSSVESGKCELGCSMLLFYFESAGLARAANNRAGWRLNPSIRVTENRLAPLLPEAFVL